MIKKQESTKDIILSELAKLPEMALSTAYLNAVSMSKYGVDVANAWLTAVQQTGALERAYQDGYYKALKECHERPRGMWLSLNFDDGDSRKWSCNKCGRGVKEQENFCPNCGAYMTRKKGED